MPNDIFMVARPAENPIDNEQPQNREKIRQILKMAHQIVHKDPLKILEKVAKIIDLSHLNDLARRFCLLLAEESPKALLDNQHLIKGQVWAERALKIARANRGRKS